MTDNQRYQLLLKEIADKLESDKKTIAIQKSEIQSLKQQIEELKRSV